MTLKYARRVFARLACLLAAATPLAGVSPAAGDALIDGDSLVQNEISLTTVPGQAGTLVMAYNDDPYPGATAGLGIASRQGAAGKWATTQIPHPTAVPPLPAPPAVTTWVFDPTITADSAGNVYAGFIGAGSTQTWSFDSGLYVARSPTGSYGQAWNPPVQVSYDAAPGAATDPSYRFNDRCQITSDTVSTGSGAGNVYISWIKDRGFNVGFQSDIYFATSTDQGATWTYPTPHPVTT